MANLPPPVRTALMPVVGPIRALLRDLESPEVPASLHKVVAYTGKRLPPPLLKSLVVELDRNDVLRDKLAEAGGDDLDPAVLSFLERKPGWWMALAGDAAAAAVPAAPVDDEVPKLQAKLDEAKRRIADLRATSAALRADVKQARKQGHDNDQDGDARSRVSSLRQERDDLRGRLEEESALRAEIESRFEALKRRKERRQRPQATDRDPGVVGLRDPIAAARRLDVQADFFAAGARTGERERPVSDQQALSPHGPPVVLPAGIAPDSVDAIGWLIREAGPVPVIVDGYNVTFLLDPNRFVASDVRRKLVAELERLIRSARSAHRVVVVFDSSVDGGSQPGPSPGGVEIHFATDAPSADDEIVERAIALSGHAVVITNDRELRERVGMVGALALWGDALAAWIEV